jgi:hypothetical protein
VVKCSCPRAHHEDIWGRDFGIITHLLGTYMYFKMKIKYSIYLVRFTEV